jgi:hypothetical protein
MSRYFLHLVTRSSRSEDPEGSELDSLAAARAEAIAAAREIMSECLRWGLLLGLNRHFDIVDARGRVLERVLFAEAIPGQRRQGIRQSL